MTADSNPQLHPNQYSVAADLGLDVASLNSAAAAVDAIEAALGEAAEAESARWFAMAVLRHLRKEKWTELVDSGVDDVVQMNLAKDCLAVTGFSASLRTVTKDARSKYRIVGFASSKKIERAVLATGTKAYKIAAYVVLEAGLIEQHGKLESKKTTDKKRVKTHRSELPKVEKTAVGRRAKRRGYFEDEFMNVADTTEVTEGKNQAISMSEEEFADLEAALSNDDAEIIQQNWGDQQNEDRWSRILGLLAGVGFFVFVALLFLQ